MYSAGSNCMYCLTLSTAAFLTRLATGSQVLGGLAEVLAAAATLVPVLGMVAELIVKVPASEECQRVI